MILPDVPSGCEIQQLLGDIDQANTEVGDLSGYWRDLLNATLETAKKFEADHRYTHIISQLRATCHLTNLLMYTCCNLTHSSLAGWIKTRDGELAGADAVRGVPEGVQEQLEQLKVYIYVYRAYHTYHTYHKYHKYHACMQHNRYTVLCMSVALGSPGRDHCSPDYSRCSWYTSKHHDCQLLPR